MAGRHNNLKEYDKLLALGGTIKRALRATQTAKSVRKHLLPEMDRIYRRAQDIRFQTGGASRGVGGAWLPLRPWYARWKQERVGNQPILSFSRQMRASFISARHPKHIMKVKKGIAEFGSRHPLAVQHDLGINTPQRMLRGASEQTLAEWMTALTKYVQETMAMRVIKDLQRLNGGSLATPMQQGVDRTKLMKRLGEDG